MTWRKRWKVFCGTNRLAMPVSSSSEMNSSPLAYDSFSFLRCLMHSASSAELLRVQYSIFNIQCSMFEETLSTLCLRSVYSGAFTAPWRDATSEYKSNAHSSRPRGRVNVRLSDARTCGDLRNVSIAPVGLEEPLRTKKVANTQLGHQSKFK